MDSVLTLPGVMLLSMMSLGRSFEHPAEQEIVTALRVRTNE